MIERKIPPDHLADALVSLTIYYDIWLTYFGGWTIGANAEISSLKRMVQEATNSGELKSADDLLGQALAKHLASPSHLDTDVAMIISYRAAVAMSDLRYADAAAYFSEAARLLPPSNEYLYARIGLYDAAASALYAQGLEYGDKAVLASLVDQRRIILRMTPRKRPPLEWIQAQDNLGSALWTLGQRESVTTSLEEAVATFRTAHEETIQDGWPKEEARARALLGAALLALGQRQTGTLQLEEAVKAFRAALQDSSREDEPLSWALTSASLGTTLIALAERSSDAAKADEAYSQIEAALAVVREGYDAASIEGYERELSKSRDLRARLRAN